MTPDHLSYRYMLLDFRADIFQRVTLVIALFCLVAAYLLIFMKPLPHQLVLFLFTFSGFTLLIRRTAQRHLNTARYLFLISLYIALATGMILLPVSWLPFLVFPLVFIGELLVTYVNVGLILLFLGFTSALTLIGYTDYPLEPFTLFLGFMLIITNRGIQAINLLVLWYSSTYQQANELLHEARDRRAELAQILKSLEISYETQRRLQAQLVFARQQADEARRLKERFASNISHELRTPLNIILGFAEIMHLTPEVYGDVLFSPKLQRDIYQIHRSSRHLLEMIDDVLDLSHIELSQFSLSFERTNLKSFLSETVDMVQNLFKGKPVEFIVNIPNDLPEIEIDRTRIRQVMINLLTNAQRFTHEGHVTLTVRVHEAEIAFEIADTGVGIPQDQMSLIFEEFFQIDYSLSRAHGGTGLGLAITKRFVEAHRGQLRVVSQEGKGSIFTFTLPQIKNAQETSPLLESSLSKSTAPDSLWLVVDSDLQVGKLMQRYAHGRQIVQIDDHTMLEDAIHQHNPQGIILNQPPNAAILPSIESISIPVIACSLPSTSQIVRMLGVDGCLAKPVRPHQITAQFQRYSRLRTVLVVDDDLGVVQLVQRCIETQRPDIQIQRAYNGKQALEMMRSTPPDLVLLDLVMPEMSGFEVIEAMKSDSLLACMPVILLTATKYVTSDEEMRGSMMIHQSGGLRPMGVLKLIDVITHTLETQAGL